MTLNANNRFFGIFFCLSMSMFTRMGYVMCADNESTLSPYIYAVGDVVLCLSVCRRVYLERAM